MNDHDPQDLKGGLVLFEKDFQLDPNNLKLGTRGSYTYREAHDQVLKLVEQLLTKDFNKLIHVLYRIDVAEDKLKEALGESSANPAEVITTLIMKRELQKVVTRKKQS